MCFFFLFSFIGALPTYSLHQLSILNHPQACSVHVHPCTIQTCRQYLLINYCFTAPLVVKNVYKAQRSNFTKSQSYACHISVCFTFSDFQGQTPACRLLFYAAWWLAVRWLHTETAWPECKRQEGSLLTLCRQPVQKPCTWYSAELSRLKSKSYCLLKIWIILWNFLQQQAQLKHLSKMCLQINVLVEFSARVFLKPSCSCWYNAG